MKLLLNNFFELNIYTINIDHKDHFKKYVKEINKLPFEKQWEYVQKKLVSKNNVDIKLKCLLIHTIMFYLH